MKAFNTAPFIRADKKSFEPYYLNLFLALSGPLFMSVFLYGLRAALIISFCIVTAVFLNAVEFFIFSNKPIINPEDIICSVILPLLCPASINMVIPSIAVAVAVIFRIISTNIIRPKMMFLCSICIGWLFLAIVFNSQMFNYTSPTPLSSFSLSVSSVGESVPSASQLIKIGNGKDFNLINLLLGTLAGPMGCSSPVVLLSCALFLIIRHTLPYQTVIGYLVSAFSLSALLGSVGGCSLLTSSLFEISSGSLMFCAIFVAGLRHFYPLTATGRWISGILMGALTVALRRLLPLEQTAPIVILTVTFFCYYFDVLSYLINNAFRYLKVMNRNRIRMKQSEKSEEN